MTPTKQDIARALSDAAELIARVGKSGPGENGDGPNGEVCAMVALDRASEDWHVVSGAEDALRAALPPVWHGEITSWSDRSTTAEVVYRLRKVARACAAGVLA